MHPIGKMLAAFGGFLLLVGIVMTRIGTDNFDEDLMGWGSLLWPSGCCVLLIGLLLGLATDDKSQRVIVLNQGANTEPAMVGSSPVVGGVPVLGAPVSPMSSAPSAPVVVGSPGTIQTSAPVIQTPTPPLAESKPDQIFYDSLIEQGYQPAEATKFTAQQYPGFQGNVSDED